MSQQTKTIPEMQDEILQLQAAMSLPGIPPDEIAIYQSTIQRIQSEINARTKGPQTTIPTKTAPEPIKQTTPPPNHPPSPLTLGEGSWVGSTQTPLDISTNNDLTAGAILSPRPDGTHRVVTTSPLPSGEGSGVGSTISNRVIHAGNQTPVSTAGLPATIHAEHDTDPYNPRITITWPDGYTITVNETEARSRFTSTLRDTVSLRLVQQERFDAMWRWSSPWRAAGYYQALTALRGGQPPTLRDLGINRPNQLTQTVFEKITTKQP